MQVLQGECSLRLNINDQKARYFSGKTTLNCG